jgi:predicted nucleic acid-binding protein
LTRSLKWPAAQVADQLDDLLLICGTPLTLDAAWRRHAAHLAERFKLTFYDASYVAAASGLGVPLVSADRQLLEAGLAESVTDFTSRMLP